MHKPTTGRLLRRVSYALRKECDGRNITGLEGRGNGGRAYKVVDGSMRRFDPREDQLMEILRDVGIMPGGVVPDIFIRLTPAGLVALDIRQQGRLARYIREEHTS